MTMCFFVSDLHGREEQYEKLFNKIASDRPDAVFIGGDVLPHGSFIVKTIDISHRDFINDYLVVKFSNLQDELKDQYPRVFIILGNDDGRFEELSVLDAGVTGIWEYMHNRKIEFKEWVVYGYSYIPPTPFQLKDWERYDVSRSVDPACIPPEEGIRTIPVSEYEQKYATIKDDLDKLVNDDPLEHAIFLFHSPPYQTNLDRADLDGKTIDHAPLCVNVGSIAIQRFIDKYQPLLTLHGHVHESARITNSWKDKIGRTYMFSAAHDGSELSIIRFELEDLSSAKRELI